MPSLAVLYDPENNSWLRFSQPVEELEIHHLDEVLPSLERLEQRVEREGLYAAGFISYEAASAFDDALQTFPATDFPLLSFGLFSKTEQVKLPSPEQPFVKFDWQARDSQDIFARKVESIRAAIARGETYQVNLTFPLTAETNQDPWQLFLQLAQRQQPQSCGFLQSDRWAICSASPELFFTREGEKLTMRPMKGTAPRGRTLSEDRQQAEELHVSVKNRAENIMILDMVRNDLGRIAPPGKVRTEAICTLEKYPTVWQLTSTATASSNASLADIFQALFPCASITGAPKAKTMQIITQSEDQAREIYTGTFGWIAPARRAHFNVAIRTALIDKQKKQISYGVGAGITWDSDSAAEYRECLDKAAILSRPANDFALIETLRWTPGKGYFLLGEHLARLQESATYFDFDYSAESVQKQLQELSKSFSTSPQRVRLLLHQDGRLEVTFMVIEKESSGPIKIAMAQKPVESKNSLLYHKTTQRQIYETSLAGVKGVDEVVLWNESGEITECCTANLVVRKGNQLLTPSLSCGLLPGTYRAYLLHRGIIQEATLTAEDLRRSSEVFLINAVRKWRKAFFIE